MMPLLFAIFALVTVTILRVREYRFILSPDGGMYRDMANGVSTPPPFCWRVGFPRFVRLMSRVTRLKIDHVMPAVGLFTYLCVLPATVWLAYSMGAPLAYAVGVAFLLVVSPAMFSYPIVMPYLADCLAAPLAVSASALVVQGSSWLAMFVLLALGFVKESYLAMAAAFTLIYNPSLWWVVVPGVVAHLVLRKWAARVEAPDSKPELISPFSCVSTNKRVGFWFSNRLSIKQAGASPYVFAWYAPESLFLWPVLAVCVLAWAQAHVGTDHDRLIWQSGPWMLAALAPIVPVNVLVVACLVSMWCPWHGTESKLEEGE